MLGHLFLNEEYKYSYMDWSECYHLLTPQSSHTKTEAHGRGLIVNGPSSCSGFQNGWPNKDSCFWSLCYNHLLVIYSIFFLFCWLFDCYWLPLWNIPLLIEFFYTEPIKLGYFNKLKDSRSLMELKWQMAQSSKNNVTSHAKIVLSLWVCIFVCFYWEAMKFLLPQIK